MTGDPLPAEELEAIYANAPIGLALIDKDLRYLKVNRALAEMNGISVEAHIGKTIHDIVPGLAPAVEGAFRSVFTTGTAALNIELSGETVSDPGVRRTWIESISPVLRAGGEVRAALVAVTEITEQKAAEDRLRMLALKEQHLMQELTHRISNGLGLVSALLDLQARNAAANESREAFLSASARVRGLALIHRLLYAPQHTGLATDIRGYLSGLCSELGSALMRGTAIRLDVASGVTLSPDRMVPLGIIVSELITNACKHAGTPTPGISLTFRRENERGVLSVCDEGKGLPQDFSPQGTRSIGMKVIRSQVAQLFGEIHACRGPRGGACFVVSFPMD